MCSAARWAVQQHKVTTASCYGRSCSCRKSCSCYKLQQQEMLCVVKQSRLGSCMAGAHVMLMQQYSRSSRSNSTADAQITAVDRDFEASRTVSRGFVDQRESLRVGRLQHTEPCDAHLCFLQQCICSEGCCLLPNGRRILPFLFKYVFQHGGVELYGFRCASGDFTC